MKRRRHGAVAILAAGLFGAVLVTPSFAAKPAVRQGGPFDGLWSVLIQTQYGPCDPTYRYPARIAGGRVMQVDNDYSYQISGAVSSNGGISVVVSKSGQSATGYGRLAGSRGGGTWRADGGQCAGSWSAARRS
jgi:hypothetical protein